MSSPFTRHETRRSGAAKYKPYTLAYDDDEDEFVPAPKKKSTSRSAGSRIVLAEKRKPKTTSEPLPPPLTNLGMPSREQYQAIEDEYIQSLHPRKREKALLSQAMFDMVWDVLHDPLRSRVGSPQFRWWVRKMFVLSHLRSELSPTGEPDLSVDASTPVVLHEDRPVALKEQIYEALCYCHDLSNHGGRDKTTMVIREHYSWIPKELVAQFVRACPTCVYKKTGNKSLVNALNDVGNSPLLKMEEDEGKYSDGMAGAQERLGVYSHRPVLANSPAVPALLNAEATLSSDWPAVTLAPVPQASANSRLEPLLNTWMPASYASRGDWSSGSLPTNADGTYIHPQEYHDLPPIRRLHSADDAFPYDSNSRVTLPPLQQVLSDGGVSRGRPPVSSTWNPALAPEVHAWGSSSPAWTAPPFPQLTAQVTVHSGFNFASESPLSSPSRRWYHALDVPLHGTGERQQAPERMLHIDPALLGPVGDYFSLVHEVDSPVRPRCPSPGVGNVAVPETTYRSRRTLSVQSLITGSSSMTSLTLHADADSEGGREGELGQELTTPVRRAVAGVPENAKSPGGSVYLHPSRFSLSG